MIVSRRYQVPASEYHAGQWPDWRLVYVLPPGMRSSEPLYVIEWRP